MMIKYYVCADVYTTGEVNGRTERIREGRVKAIVDAEPGCYADAISKGKDVINASLPEKYAACNYGCMAVEDADKMGDADTYAAYATCTGTNVIKEG